MNRVWVHHSNDVAYTAISDFVSSRIWGKKRAMPLGSALAVTEGDKLMAGVVVTNYDSVSGVIEVSGASDSKRWMSRGLLYDIYDYAFNQMGCQAVIQRNDPDDKQLARMMGAYGFERHDIPRMRGRYKPEAVFILGDDVWRANGFHKENING